MVSHISEVSAVRTERELSRALSMQLRIEDGLSGENDEILDDVGFVGLLVGLEETRR